MANEMFSSLPDVMTAEQLASALQIGGRKMVMKKDLLEWLNSRTNRPQ